MMLSSENRERDFACVQYLVGGKEQSDDLGFTMCDEIFNSM